LVVRTSAPDILEKPEIIGVGAEAYFEKMEKVITL